MSALMRITEASRPSHEVRKVPTGDFAILARSSWRCDGRFDQGNDAFGTGQLAHGRRDPGSLRFPASPLSLAPVRRNWRGVIPVQRLNAWLKELTSPYPNSHAISETGRSRSAR